MKNTPFRDLLKFRNNKTIKMIFEIELYIVFQMR